MVALAALRCRLPPENRAEHDRWSLLRSTRRDMAVSYDPFYDRLDAGERAALLEAIRYQGSAAYDWLRRRLVIHLGYQNSHGQQAMHALLTATLAVATDLPEAKAWTDYLVRQYVNRIPWGEDDGGYTEGQTYSHKFQFILDGLYALKTATGIDLVPSRACATPAPSGSTACRSTTGGITGATAIPCSCQWWATRRMPTSATSSPRSPKTPTSKWWSDSCLLQPQPHSACATSPTAGLQPRLPIDIPQARLFPRWGNCRLRPLLRSPERPHLLPQQPLGQRQSCPQRSERLRAARRRRGPRLRRRLLQLLRRCLPPQICHGDRGAQLDPLDGEGQPKSVSAREMTAFFNAPEACFFIGDAASAYPSD